MMMTQWDFRADLESRSPSILPTTAVLEWHSSAINATSRAMGRYAAFGPIVDISYGDEEPMWGLGQEAEGHSKFEGEILFINHNSCDADGLSRYLNRSKALNASTGLLDQDTIVLNFRGGCSFYEKIVNFQSLGAKAVIVGNDQLGKGLLTMYSKTIPDEVTIPSIFITKETADELLQLTISNRLKLQIFTGQTPSPLLDALLALVFSPPVALMLLYLIIKLRRSHKKNMEKASKKAVKKLPVYVYNDDYLVPINEFEKNKDYYLGLSGPLLHSSSKKSFTARLLSFIIPRNSIEEDEVNAELSLDTVPEPLRTVNHRFSIEELNQYQISQCSICLNQFRKLKSKVILLPCNHYFHYRCCLNWLCNYKKLCPICKHDITKRRRTSTATTASRILSIFSRDSHSSSQHIPSLPSMVDRSTSANARGSLPNYNSITNQYNPILTYGDAEEDNESSTSSNDIDYNEENAIIDEDDDSSNPDYYDNHNNDRRSTSSSDHGSFLDNTQLILDEEDLIENQYEHSNAPR